MTDERGPILEVSRLTVAAPGGRLVLNDVSLSVYPGELHGVVGMSGAGKTTLLRAVLGQLQAGFRLRGGQIWLRLDDVPHEALAGWGLAVAMRSQPPHLAIDLTRVPDEFMQWLLGRTITYVPQNRLDNLPPLLTVHATVTDAVRAKSNVTSAAACGRATGALDGVGLPAHRHQARPRQLSGGQRQKVLIALARLHTPTMKLYDEPTTALDPVAKKELLEKIRAGHEGRQAVALVTHDLHVAQRYCNRVSILFQGGFVESGPARAVLDQPRHPYTKQLVGSLPQSGRRPLPVLTVRSDSTAAATNGGCPFYQYCPDRIDICARESPQSQEVAEGWQVRCHVAAGVPGGNGYGVRE